MVDRKRRSLEAVAADAVAKAKKAKNKLKKVRDGQRTRRAIIGGLSIEAMADAGDQDCAQAWSKMKAGLTRPQDRAAFSLEPLPKIEDTSSSGPVASSSANLSPPLPKPVAAPVSPSVPMSHGPAVTSPGPKPDAPVVDVVALQEGRLRAAFNVFDRSGKLVADEAVLVEAVIAWESVSGQLWERLKNRAAVGLSDKPGRRL